MGLANGDTVDGVAAAQKYSLYPALCGRAGAIRTSLRWRARSKRPSGQLIL